MTSPLDAFTYGLFPVWTDTAKGLCQDFIGHRYRRLAAIRYGITSKGLEQWGVLDTRVRMHNYPAPVFYTLDDAASYIIEIEGYIDWKKFDNKTYNPGQILDLIARLEASVYKHFGIPTMLDIDDETLDRQCQKISSHLHLGSIAELGS
jgi:hypothetical protein